MNFILFNNLKILLKNKYHKDISLPKNMIDQLLNLKLPNFPEKYSQIFMNLMKSYNLNLSETSIKSYINLKKLGLVSSLYLNLYNDDFFINNNKNYFIPENIKITIIDCFKDSKLYFSILLEKSDIMNNINELQLLNIMLMNKLVIIEIEENQEIEKILEINSLIINIKKMFYFFSVHIILIVKKNSHIKVLHKHENISLKENEKLLNTVNSEVIEIQLAENSSIEYTNVQNLKDCSYNLSNMIIRQEKNSIYKLNNVLSGSKYRYNNVEVTQNGSKSVTDINWLNLGDKEQYLYDNVKIIHNCSNGDSKQNFRGIYKEDASSWTKSFIKINNNLNNIITDQVIRSLLLSNKTYVKVEPFMEINSKDINSNHAVAIEQVDEVMLFYLQSRGMFLIDAKKLITFNFIEKLIKQISTVDVKNFIAKFLKEKINKIFAF